MHRIDDLNAWRIFCEVVHAGGLNAACDRLGCEPSTASRALRGLEAELGITLFSRTTRPVTLTEMGKRAYQRAIGLVGLHREIVTDLQGDKDKLAGLIRVCSHAGIGPQEITPALVEFQQIYPDIQFELHELSARLPDGFVTADGTMMDVAIGYGENQDMPGVVRRYSGEMPFVPCAAPSYIQRNGMPIIPDDCRKHTGVLILSPTRSATQTLENAGRSVALEWKNAILLHNLISVKSALLLGAGVVPDMSLFHCAKEIEDKTVIPVLPGWHRKQLSCFIFAREESFEKKRVKVFVDWLAEREHRFMQRLKNQFPQFYGS
ncbi:MAG TPA: LysR family transcriptional regulator [Candidatus Aphodousia faecipullorum]|nr:LysR family transcriptional regulator [Candidatus Aphodousia faecipullorum]